jgi:putative ABC transport system permease protein
MATLIQDVRYAFRVMRMNLGFTAVAVLTLALGVGANTAIFSVVDSVLFRPWPYPHPERIVEILKQYKDGTGVSVCVPLFNYWKEHGGVFEHVAAFSTVPNGFNLAERGLPERVPGVRVTADFFKVFGIQPLRGRAFLPEEDRPGGERAVVLSYDLWRARFNADPSLVGNPIVIDGQPYTVAGIMPQGFRFPDAYEFGRGPDLWIPFQLPQDSQDPANYLVAIGRLKPDLSRQQAQARMSVVTQQLRREQPRFVDADEGVKLLPLHEALVGNIRPVLLILLGAVGFVLLIACVNVANLLLSRSAARAKEIAIRSAMGAGRWRLTRQLIVESMLLGVLGGAAGLGVAYAGVQALVALSPLQLPGASRAGLDGRVLGFALVLSVLTGLLFGLAPALSISRTRLNESLKESSTRSTAGGHRRRLSGALVASETALSFVLLVGAGLLVESFIKLGHVEPGFDPRHVLTFETTLPEAKYGTPPALEAFCRSVLEQLQALPGVESAAAVTSLPTEFGPDFPFTIEGRQESSPGGASGDSQYRVVSPDYFRALRIPLLRGRFFNDADTAQSPGTVIINQAMARQFWPHQDPVGQTLLIAKQMGPEWADRPRQIVGVVGDVKDTSLNEPPPLEMFIPYTQVPAVFVALAVRLIPARWVIRTQSDPLALSAPARQAVLAVDANEPIAGVQSLEEVLAGSLGRWRFAMFLLGAFAGLALVLAAVGVYGVLSYSVSQRTHEIGIRMALGARRQDVLKLVVGRGMMLALLGVALGIAGAFGLTRFLAGLLYGVRPSDPLTFVAVALVLLGVAVLASYLPARRAAKVDPMVALRYE